MAVVCKTTLPPTSQWGSRTRTLFTIWRKTFFWGLTLSTEVVDCGSTTFFVVVRVQLEFWWIHGWVNATWFYVQTRHSLHTNLMEDFPKLCFLLPRGAQTQASQIKFLGGGHPGKWNDKIGEIRGRLDFLCVLSSIIQFMTHDSTLFSEVIFSNLWFRGKRFFFSQNETSLRAFMIGFSWMFFLFPRMAWVTAQQWRF